MKHLILSVARLAILVGVLLLAGRLPAAGASGDALLNKLIEKGVLTREEADAIRAETDAEVAEAVRAQNPTRLAAWIDELRWAGDLRLRAEHIEYEDSLRKSDRLRFRFRLRFGLTAQFSEWTTVGLRLITGDGEPVSTNQSFTDTFRKKPIDIDLAYVAIHPPGWDWVQVSGGKLPNPLWQPAVNSPLVYDNDLTPEGIAEEFSWKIGDEQRVRLFANFGQFVIDELSGDSNDPYLLDFQGGIETWWGGDPKNPRVRVTLAGGYLQTVDLDDADRGYRVGDSGNLGNAVSAAGSSTNFLADFEVVRVSAECAVSLSDGPFLGTPAQVTVSGEYVENLADAYDDLAGATTNIAPGQTTGWSAQVAFGKAREKGQWQIAYQYKYLEADATWDAITDSDFGLGGTDRQGHLIKLAYQLQDWWQLGFNVLLTEKISRRPNAGHNTVGQRGEDLLRLQADSLFRF